MNCIIIEDESNSLEHLENQLRKTGHAVDILAKIDSIEEAVPWLKTNHTDLIFLDIQLGDGLSFEIFDHIQVTTPVIFTTSFDQYAIKAFELNSISYLLKPVKLDDLRSALEKYNRIVHGANMNEKIISFHSEYQKRFLVRSGSSFQPIALEDIAYFYLQNKRFVFIVTKDKQQYLYDSTMEILEQRLDPSLFFRINRHFIIGFDAVRKLNNEDGRLKIEAEPEHKEEVVISINKTTPFKNWLDR